MKKFYTYLMIFFFVCFSANLFSQSKTISIMHVNDTHSNLAKGGERDANLKGTTGGIARAASILGYAYSTDTNTILLHAGDLFIGDLFFNAFLGVPEFQWLQSMHFAAMTLGNHESNLMEEGLATSLDLSFPKADFPILSANTVFNDTSNALVKRIQRHIQPYVIKTVDGVKIGIFGLTTADYSLFTSSLISVSTDYAGAAMSSISSLKGQGCDVIILLSHLGINYDLPIAQIPGIDFIIGGHDHYVFNTPKIVTHQDSSKTYIFQAGAHYNYIGSLTASIDMYNRISGINYQLISLDDNIPEDPATKAFVDTLIAKIEAQYQTPFYSQKFKEVQSTLNEVADSLEYSGIHDTQVGNLVTDAFRDYTKTDIAITACGSTAQALYKGPVTPDDIFKMIGYGFNTYNTLGYSLVTFKMRGDILYAVLNSTLPYIATGSDEMFIVCSGMKYSYQYSSNPTLISITIGGKPLDPTATYSLTTNEYIYGYLKMNSIPTSNDSVYQFTEYEAVMAYLTKDNSLYITAPTDVRVTAGAPFSESVEYTSNIKVYPNPAANSFSASFEIVTPSRCSLNIYDIFGNKVGALCDEWFDAGSYTKTFETESLSSGIYYCRMSNGGNESAQRIVICK